MSRYLRFGIVLAVLLLFPLGEGVLFSSFYLALLTRIFIFAVIVIGFDLLAGYTGMVSYGHALLFGTGAYVIGMLLKYWTPWFWPVMAVTVLASGLIAYIVGRLALRTREIYFVFLTFAFAQFFFVTAQSWDFVGGANGLSGVPKPLVLPGQDLSSPVAFYYFTLAWMGAALLFARLIIRSPFGRVMVGIRENEERTKFLGFDTHLVIRRVFVISGIYGGVAGGLMAAFNSFVSPTFYHPAVSGEIIIMSLLGGMGTLIGPIFGSALVIILGDVLSSWLAESWMMVLGGIFAAFILFSPGGIMGLARKIGSRTKRGEPHGHP